ncbi:MAG: gliding motility-associated C-terminal domain-containing protein [Flavobacteriaceae bacterium]|nr:gliding motility-associated C-terminal domain-containing protein [Flavobacteriaceae bacterium]
MLYKTHIRNIIIIFTLLSGVLSYAQLTAKVGDTTTLSVQEVSSDTYVWELYDSSGGIDFAKTKGNCPTEKAIFVNGNTGNSVDVKWLTKGVYFYKVTVKNSCTNNIKIGKIIVGKADKPKVPKIVVTYNCDETATLKAVNYNGSLLWSTGETTETITVSEKGMYSLVQILNKEQSESISVRVEQLEIPNAPIVTSPINIPLGERLTLTAEGCSNGTIVWYSDEELTQKIEDLSFVPNLGEHHYYVVCQDEKGCVSPYSELTVMVNPCTSLFKSIEIPQGFSPNGDGINDVWSIKDLKNYCEKCNEEATVKIFNRWGNKVYEKDKYMLKHIFKGFSNQRIIVQKSEKLPVGVYYYIIKFKDEKKVKTGYFYLNY